MNVNLAILASSSDERASVPLAKLLVSGATLGATFALIVIFCGLQGGSTYTAISQLHATFITLQVTFLFSRSENFILRKSEKKAWFLMSSEVSVPKR